MSENTTMVKIQAKDETKAAIDSATRNLNNLTNAQKEAEAVTRRAARQMRQGFAQAGYQIQDVAVQLQYGANPFIVIGQQGSQIASIFGAGGIVVGAFVAVGAALASATLPHIFNAVDGLEALEKAGEDVEKTFRALDSGTLILSDSFLKMAQASGAAATIELRRQRRDLLAAMEITQSEMIEQAKSFNTILTNAMPQTGLMFEILNANSSGALAEVAKQYQNLYGITEENIRSLQALTSAAMSGGVSDIEALIAELASIQEQPGIKEEFNELAESLGRLLVGTVNSTEQVAQLDAALADLDAFMNKTGESTDNFTQSLQDQINTYGMSAAAIELYKAQQAGASNEEMGRVAALAAQHEAMVQATADERAATQAAEQQIAAEKKVQEGILSIIDGLNRQIETYGKSSSEIAVYNAQLAGANSTQQETIRLLAEEIQARETLGQITKKEDDAQAELYRKQLEAFKVFETERENQLSPLDKLNAEFDARRDALLAAQEITQLMTQEHNDMLANIEKERIDAVAKYQQDAFDAEVKLLQARFQATSQLAGAMAGILEEGTTAQRVALAIQKGFAVGEALMNMHVAVSKALAKQDYVGVATATAVGLSAVAGIKAVSFEGGGFTGYGARVGGLDGKGGMPAIVHPNETIIDHTKGGAGAVVNININANDARGFDELLLKRRGMIASMVQSSLNNLGRSI